MADYSQVNDYSDKDALATGNPLKLIKGSDVDQEFAAISTAIASKFDSTDIATAGEAQAGTDNTKVITPARLTAWAQNDAGVVEDLQALSDPNADRILFWDDSAGTTTWLTVGAGLTLSGTDLTADTSGTVVPQTRTLTAGVGLSGGGDLSADRTFDMDINELTIAGIAAGDQLAFADTSAAEAVRKITFANFEASLDVQNLTNYVANADIDHTTITITAGSGLSYSVGGTDISADSTIDLDINELTAITTPDDADEVAVYDSSAAGNRKITVGNLVGDQLGDAHYYLGTNEAVAASTEEDIVFDTVEYDLLQRGTFAVGTGRYTATVDTRLWVYAKVTIQAMDDDDSITLRCYNNATVKLRYYQWNDTDNNTPEVNVHVAGLLKLTAADVVKWTIETSSAETMVAGSKDTYVDIMELA